MIGGKAEFVLEPRNGVVGLDEERARAEILFLI